MSIRFRCPHCNAIIKVSERHAGEKGKCSTCRAKIVVPTLAEAAEWEAGEARETRDKPAAPVPPPAAPIRKESTAPRPVIADRKPADRVVEQVTAPPPPKVPVEEPKPKAPEKVAKEAPEKPAAPEYEAYEEVDRSVREESPQVDEVVEELEEPYEEELAPVPAPAISTGEGNDVLSAIPFDGDLVHIHDDEEHEHAPSLVKKSVGLEGVEELVDMTAMVDIVFFLLIFFMMTSMQNVSSSIETPSPDPDKVAAKAAASASADSDADAIVIRIEADNSLKFDGEAVFGEKDLRSRLGVAFPGGGSGTKKLTVLGHGDALHGTVVMVLDAAHDTGIQDIRLAVADEEQ